MNKMLRATGKREVSVRTDDFYPTPDIAVVRLIEERPDILSPNYTVAWEPACGDGAICKVLNRHKIKNYGSDLVDRGWKDGRHGIDFLMERHKFAADVNLIITNPPFKLAEQFVQKAMDLNVEALLLLRLNFLEGVKRQPLLRKYLADVGVFSGRLPMMHRPGYEGPRNESGAVCFAWFRFSPLCAESSLRPDLYWL